MRHLFTFYARETAFSLIHQTWTLNDFGIYVRVTFGIPGHTAIYKTSSQSSSAMTRMILCVILPKIHYARRYMEHILFILSRSRKSGHKAARFPFWETYTRYQPATWEQIWISLRSSIHFRLIRRIESWTIRNRGTPSNDYRNRRHRRQWSARSSPSRPYCDGTNPLREQ